jgi:hypothetical protein
MKTKQQIINKIEELTRCLESTHNRSTARRLAGNINYLNWVLSENPKNQRVFEGLQNDLFDKNKTVKKYYKD